MERQHDLDLSYGKAKKGKEIEFDSYYDAGYEYINTFGRLAELEDREFINSCFL